MDKFHPCSRRQTPLGYQILLAMTICLLLFVAIRPQGTTAATSITAVFDSFTTSNTSAFNFVGSAAVDTGLSALSLTPSASGYGAAWWNQRIKLGNNRSFSAHFTFSMSDMVNSPGDGMTFALQTNSNNSGGGGGGLGIEGISPSFAVEFDTFDNAGDDTGSNQIGIDIDGDVTSVWKMNAPVALYGGTLHYAWIDYDGSTDTLDIRLSDSSTRPGTATASVVINSVSGGRHLYDILGENVYVGFTAATGWAHENHYVKSFYFNNDYIAGSITPSTETYTPFPAIVTLTPSLTSIPADGSSTTTLNICAKDSGGNALSGQSIALSTTAGTLSTASVTTGVGGCASATLTSAATPANATVSATAEGGVVKQAQVAFSTTKAVKNAGGAYIQGTYVEIGINNNGYFGAAAPNAPAGFHDNESRFLGFVADYQKDGWTNGTPNFGGDYFTPGTEYEGFGIACTGGSAANYGSAASTITTDSLTVGPGLTADWIGHVTVCGSSLQIKHHYYMLDNSTFVKVDTTIINTGASTITGLKFARGVDPDNEQIATASYKTTNTVLSQPGSLPDASSTAAKVVARGITYPSMELFLRADDTRSRVNADLGFGISTVNIDATLTSPVLSSVNDDQAIMLAYDLGTLASGAETRVTYYYGFNGTDLDNTLSLGTILPSFGSTDGSTRVTISGTGFDANSTASFGGSTASCVVTNATTLTCDTPPHTAGSVDVAVTNTGNSTTQVGAYTYIDPPTVTGVNPVAGSTLGGTSVVVSGTNFTSDTTAKFGTLAASCTYQNANTLNCTTPANPAGAVNVSVTNPVASATLNNSYTYVVPPTVSNVSPSTGLAAGGTSVTITGTNFNVSSTATFGGSAASCSYVDSTTLTCTTPAHAAGAVNVVVTNPVASSPLVNGFTYVTAIAPTAFTSPDPAGGTYGAAYSHTFVANGTPAPAYSLQTGSLPTGLSLSAGGVLNGTPSAAGDFTFTVRASNAGGYYDQQYTVTISKANTTTTITGDASDPSIYGISYTVSVTVTSATSGTPGGSLTVSDGINSCNITYAGGTETCSLPSTSAGSRTITATYAGNGNFNASNDTEGHSIIPADTATGVTRSVATPVYGQPLSLTATVTTTNGSYTPAGSVQFSIDGATYDAPVALNGSGIAVSPSTNLLSAGSHTYSAAFLGDSNNNASNSLPATSFTVDKNSTTTSVVSSDDSSVYGQPFHLTATVNEQAPSVVTPVGQVQFYFDGQPLGAPVNLSSGQAVSADVHSLLGSHPLVGPHTFSAEYLGNSNSLPSDSGAAQAQSVTPAPTTLLITPDINPVVYGNSVEMTVTVSSGGGSITPPAGTVQLTINGINYGSPITLNASGIGKRLVTYLNLWPGHHAVRGYFTPAAPAQFIASDNTASPLDQVVNKANPVITITPDVLTPIASQPVVYTVTVAPSIPTQGTPTGTVQFTVDGIAQGSPVNLDVDGKATLSIQLPAGSHAVTVSYSGDDYFLSVPTSPALNVSMAKGVSTTQITGINPATSVVGQPVTVSVLVQPVSPATAVPDGMVTISNGSVSCNATLNEAGVGSCQITPTAPGSPNLSATYGGSDEFNGSSAAPFAGPVVAKADSSVEITGFSPASPVTGQPVTVSFKVSAKAPGAGTPAGSVSISSDAGPICSASVSGPDSTGSCDLVFSQALTTDINADYAGDGNFNPSSTTTGANLAVQKAATSLALASSGSPSVYGQPVHFTATLSVTAPGEGTPSGSIQFTIDGDNFGSPVPLSGGSAVSPDISSLSVASHTIGATYLGDDNFTSAAAATINQLVNKADTTLVLTSSRNPSPYGQSVVVTATLSPVAPSTATPNSGSVQFFVDGVPYGSAVSLGSDGKAQKVLPYTAIWVGTHSITAVYAGSTNFNGSNNNADPLSQVIGLGEVTISLNPTVVAPVFGQAVGFETTITGVGPNNPRPSGTVQFQIDSVNLGTPVTLDALAAATSQLTASLSVGTHAVSILYSGDDFYAPTSADFTTGVTVGKADVNAAITNAPFADVFVGQPFTVNFSITAKAPGAGTPTGLVTISNGTDSCSAPVATGSCDLTPTTVGTPQLSLSYAGDANFNPANPAAIDGPEVNLTPTTLQVATSGNPVEYGTSVDITVTVTADALSTAIPEGTVQLTINNVDFGTPVALNASGKVTLTIFASNLWPGTHAIRAYYIPSTPARFEPSNNLASPLFQVVNKANPSITISPDDNTPVASQPVNYTVTVARTKVTQGTPSGKVQFYVDGSAYGSQITLNGSGTAVQSILLNAGAHAVTVGYTGDNYFLTIAASSPLNVTTDPADSSTAIVSINPLTTVVGQPVTVNVKVSPVAPAVGKPGGSVVVSNGTDSCPITLNAEGEGSCQLTPSNPGSPALTAVYAGSSNFNGSTSPTFPGPVVAKFDASVTIQSIVPASPVTGETVVIHFAAVPIFPGFGVPSGTVTITDAQGRTCNGALAPVTALGSCSIVFDQAGTTNLTVSYSGDDNFNAGTNLPVAGPTIAKAATSLALSTSATPSAYGQAVHFTASLSVTAPGSGTPTGTVQFTIDGLPFGDPVSLTGTTATSPDISTLSVGAHTIGATYAGDGNYFGSSAGNISQQVNKANTILALTSSPNPSQYGTPVLITATITAPAPSTATPNDGSVQFYVDGIPYGAAIPLGSDGIAANLLPYTELIVGTHSITAEYVDSDSFNDSNNFSAPLSQVVQKGSLNITLNTTVANPVFGQSFGFTTSVLPVNASNPLPSGTVQFKVDNVALGTPVTLDVAASAASQLISSLSVGNHAVSVLYSGDSFYNAATLDVPVGVVIGKADVNAGITNGSFAAVVAGQPFTVNFVVTAKAPGAGTPTGLVTITRGADSCSASVATGFCILTPSTTGATQLSLSYAGDGNFNSASPAAVNGPSVDKAQLSLEITNVDPTEVVVGQPVQVTIQASVTLPSTLLPTGQSVIISNGTDQCTAVVQSNGSASCLLIPTASGSPDLTAALTTSTLFETTTSPAVAGPDVTPAATTTGLVSSGNPAVAGSAVHFTATVQALSPGGGTPAGTVQFFIDGSPFGSPVTLVSGTAVSAETSLLTLGNHTVTATYAGNANYTTSSATPITQKIVTGSASEEITPAGGTLTYHSVMDGKPVTTTITVPAGAVSETIVLVYTEIPPLEPGLVRNSLLNPPDGMKFAVNFTLQVYVNGVLQPTYSFALPVSVEMEYNGNGWNESTFTVAAWTGSVWSTVGIGIVDRDLENDAITFTIQATGPSEFALMGNKGYKVFLPAIIRP